jgi:hypothetical protein
MSQVFRAYQEFETAEPDVVAKAIADPAMCQDGDDFCERHLELASFEAIERKQQMQKRRDFVQSLWDDADRFEAVIASGRYLKLCSLTEWISEYDERAWARIKNEILAAHREAAAQD